MMMKTLTATAYAALILAFFGCSGADKLVDAGDDKLRLVADEKTEVEANVFYVKMETSKGDVVIEVHPDWAPLGAAHFKELVEQKFYDECRFFRVLEGFMAQVGMNGDPKVQAEWGEKTIKDEPFKRSNTRGFVTYAKGGPHSRSTQIFFNYGDNSQLNLQGFPPFGIVVEGMPVLDSLYNGYGEGAPNGSGPSQGAIAQKGNEYLKERFPKLDYIKTARIVDKSTLKSQEKKEEPKSK
jgi:peptidyl-prolyl cis-trans isomerase A (cyclophilin A)